MSEGKPTVKAHEEVAGQLRQRILAGELKDGDQLPPEDELTELFGVARTTLREALRVLESQGLIKIRRGRGGGPVVTHPDLEPLTEALSVFLQLLGTKAADIYEARRLIEPQVAGQLARHHTPEDLVALNVAVANAHTAANNGDNVAFGLAATQVHHTLLERSGNITLATISHLLHLMTEALYSRAARSTDDQETLKRAARSYERLVTLIASGDSDGAITHWEKQMAYMNPETMRF